MLNLLLNEIRAIDTEQPLRKPVIELTHLFSNHLVWTQDKLSIVLISIHFMSLEHEGDPHRAHS